MGYGIALQTGYKWALRGGYSATIQVDADGQHDVSDARQLVSPILAGETDVCLGSRFLPHPQATPNSTPYRAGFIRRLGMSLFASIASLATGQRITDATSGYQALSAAVLELFADDRYPFDFPDADQIITLHRAGFRIREVPVRMHPNAEGRSMHSGLLRPIYYVVTMLLAIFIALIREPIPRPTTQAADRPLEPAASSTASPGETK
jgi:glycosyltransferase involved in cell wall biosynthesis